MAPNEALKSPKGRSRWTTVVAVAALTGVIAVSFVGGWFLRGTSTGPQQAAPSGDGWRAITFAPSCVAYDGVAFPTPPSVMLPQGIDCSGRFRFLDRDVQAVGFEASVDIAHADPNDIPEA